MPRNRRGKLAGANEGRVTDVKLGNDRTVRVSLLASRKLLRVLGEGVERLTVKYRFENGSKEVSLSYIHHGWKHSIGMPVWGGPRAGNVAGGKASEEAQWGAG